MLRRLMLRDVAIVRELELDLHAGFTVLTGETGTGKSILIDALQVALGGRADAALVREGAARAEVSAEFDRPGSLAAWLTEAGLDAEPDDGGPAPLLLRRTVDAQGRSRAWINGSPATVAQLREVAEHLLDIHGQHAWQSLTRPAAVRALLDAQAGIEPAPLQRAWKAWRDAREALATAQARADTLADERERLAWQLAEVDRLSPGTDEWATLNTEHGRLSHAQALLDGARLALEALREGDPSASALLSGALDALDDVQRHDPALAAVLDVLRSAQAQIDDAAHTLQGYLGRHEPDPERLAELDSRLSAWMALARRFKRPPQDLPELQAGWRAQLAQLEAAADLDGLAARVAQAEGTWRTEARAVSEARRRAAAPLADAVTAAMQQLGMAGGRFEVALLPADGPQPFGLEDVELRVAGHAGSTPRALGKVASGGELSRLALAIAVTTARSAPQSVGTLIFDEIDAGVGGAVGDAVGRMMKQLGSHVQVLSVTHLAQVAACADHHVRVDKRTEDGLTHSVATPIAGEARVAEVARMLGGDRLADTSRAHAAAMIDASTVAAPSPRAPRGGPKEANRSSRR